uniref:FBD domain-containing protein n=1 Tax=Arundo donax TaxID=35708 RepID=A0A0A9CIQ5_ARUDO
MAMVSMPKRLPKKYDLLGLKTLNLDHNHEVLATLVSCLLNSSPNLVDLRIIEDFGLFFEWKPGHPLPLAAEVWEEQINARCVEKHLSSVTYYIGSLFEGHPGGLCQFLVMNARVLKRMNIQYRRLRVKPEHAAMVEAVRSELHRWPRASPDVVLELSPVDRYLRF